MNNTGHPEEILDGFFSGAGWMGGKGANWPNVG
jgi:hypothetical protein